MNYTQNYHLGLPIPAERYDVSIVNANNTAIDTQMKNNANAIANHIANKSNPHNVTAAQVGLGNVDNTSDAAKPVSNAQQQAITSAVSTESTRATNAESALSDRITTTAGQISSEVTRATNAESALSTQISEEVTRAQGAESDLRDYVDEKISTTYKASGSVFFADLPALAESRVGNVYNIKDDFTTTASFIEGAGKEYPAGSNVVIIEKDESSYETATVESTDNPAEMGLYELDGTDYVPTEDTEPVSGKTYYELVAVPTYYYDVLAGFIDTSDFITDTDYATTQTAGIVKPDGTTVTVDANGVLSSQGGGDVSSEEMADVVNILGAKNLNSYPYTDFAHYLLDTGPVVNRAIYYGECVRNGINFSIMEDKTIKIHTDSAASDDTIFVIHSSVPDLCELTLDNGNYILNGCPEGGSENTFKMYVDSVQNGAQVSYGSDTGSGLSFTLNGDDYSQDKVKLGVYIFIAAGTRFTSDVYFRPMIRPRNIINDEYVPYTQTNALLMMNGCEHKNQFNGENLIDFKTAQHPFFPGEGLNYNEVTLKWLADETFEMNGTATNKITFSFGLAEIPPYSLCVLDGDNGYNSDCYLTARAEVSDNLEHISSFSYVTATTAYKYGYNLYVNNTDKSIKVRVKLNCTTGQVFNNFILKPTLRLIYRLNDNYLPHIKTNYQLTENADSIVPIVNVLGAKNLLPYPYSETSITKGQTTFTDNGDGTIQVKKTGTNVESYDFWLIAPMPVNDFKKLFSERYILSVEGLLLVRESGWSQTSIYVTGYSDSEGQHQTYNLASVNWSHPEDMLDMTIGLLSSTSYIGCRLYTYISSARMFTVKPMIRPYRVKDNAYVPYTRTNYQLTKDVSEKVSDYASSPSSWDTIPTQSSTKPVTSGGVYSALPSIMTGATTSANGTKGLVPAPLSADRTKFLKGDGTWSDVEHDSLSDLANVTLTTPTDGQVLKYDSTSNKWVNGDGVITNFAGLSDVNLTSLANGQLIQYNASTQKWVNIGIDTTPTQNSTNPVTSGGIYTELGKKQPTYSNDPSFWDTVPTVSSNKPVTSGGIYDSEYDIYDTIGRTGAVNMLPNRAASTVVNGITFTVNDDGSVIVNGTATAFTSVRLADFKDATFYKENIGKVLKLSGSPPGGALSNGHKLRFHYENENFVDDYGDGVVIVPDAEHSETWFVSIAVSDGATVSNLTFKPMITVPSYSGDYVPYVKSNKELMNIVLNSVRRTRRDITNDLENLSTAIERQCLEAYGYTIGDYFTGPSGCTYCLADMDTFYGGYDRYAVVNTHHIAIVVKPLMTGDIYWTTDSNVSGGYANSNLHSYLQTTVLDDIKSDFIALFGGTTGLEHLISHKKMLSTGITASTWFDDQFISALSEVQVNGSRVFGANGYQIGEARTPLQLFKKYNYNELFGPYAYWLRDIESNTRVCTTGDRGNARYEVVSNKLRVLGLILFY